MHSKIILRENKNLKEITESEQFLFSKFKTKYEEIATNYENLKVKFDQVFDENHDMKQIDHKRRNFPQEEIKLKKKLSTVKFFKDDYDSLKKKHRELEKRNRIETKRLENENEIRTALRKSNETIPSFKK